VIFCIFITKLFLSFVHISYQRIAVDDMSTTLFKVLCLILCQQK